MGNNVGRGTGARARNIMLLLAVLVSLAGCKPFWAATPPPKVTPPSRIAGTFTKYAITTAGSSPEALVQGPDGRLWFTEFNKGQIGTLATTGVLGAEYDFPNVTTAAYALTLGPDGNLWYTSFSLGKVGYVTPKGKFRQFSLSSQYARPIGITAGRDGALWFTESATSLNGSIVPAIARLTPDGNSRTEYPIPNITGTPPDAPALGIPQMITQGPDGKLWFTDAGNNSVASITTDGTVTHYAIPTAKSRPFTIIAGKANDLWFTEANAIGHLIIASGKITEYRLPASGGGVRGLALAPDGSLWCSQFQTNTITRMTLSGAFTDYPLPGAAERPNQMLIVDGLLWFTAPGSNSIDAFALP